MSTGQGIQHPDPQRTADLDAEVLEVLRQIALHRETVVLLELRSRQATQPAQGSQLARRAAHRRLLAGRLEAHLRGGGAPARHPSPLGRGE